MTDGGQKKGESSIGPGSAAELRPGLGATWYGPGVSFALRSKHATTVEVCLFDHQGTPTAHRPMEQSDDIWSIAVEGIGPGQLYGYRVDGPYAPERGHRFNPAKLLVDPYARSLWGELQWDSRILGYGAEGPLGAVRSDLDSAGCVPRSVVVDPSFDWQSDRAPTTAWSDTIIYEAHVRGLTKRHPEVPPELRGTYLGLAHPAVIEHLRSLGVTAVELLPVQHFASEQHLEASGLTNYWGYSPLAYFAPHAAYATAGRGQQVDEFKSMVRSLHEAGLEVILDVAYNHTVEGDEQGATVMLRGLDNAAYYRSKKNDRRRCEDFTGCGNTLDFSRPEVVDLAHDSLRYWVEEMHVDGFRFDLAGVLGRDPRQFNAEASFFDRLREDSVLRRVKLIAEPWDLGPGGYVAGRFPQGWAEWNDRYRDGVRSFWCGDSGSAGELQRRFVGSPDVFTPPRGPGASINYVTAHDGFTLADLVSYERKNNRANGEENRDGAKGELSANWGEEGPTTSVEITALRARLQRSFIATLALSRGVPMISHGDELGRTQGGNNNAYCQDNETTWVDWAPGADGEQLLEFSRLAFRLRGELVSLLDDDSRGAATWLDENGDPLESASDTDRPALRFGLLLNRAAPDSRPALLILFNGDRSPGSFMLPQLLAGGVWFVRLDTASPVGTPHEPVAGHYAVEPHSLACLEPRPPAD